MGDAAGTTLAYSREGEIDNGHIVLSGYSIGVLEPSYAVELVKSWLVHRSISKYWGHWGYAVPEGPDTGVADSRASVSDEWFDSVPLKFHMTVWDVIPNQELVRVDKYNNQVALTAVEDKKAVAADAGHRAAGTLPG